MADIGGGFFGENSAILKSGIHHYRLPVKSCRRATAEASRKEFG